MSGYHFKKWLVAGIAVILGMLTCPGMASAYEVQRSWTGNSYFQKPSSSLFNTPFLLNFSQRYYQTVETSLQHDSYFAFRYYLLSPFESFDKQQFILENPTQASSLAQNALQKTIRKSLEEIEFIEIIRNYLYAMTSLKMRVGANGTQVHGPTMTDPRVQTSALEPDLNHEMAINSGLTFADDLRLGIRIAFGYHKIISKLNYYPTSRNELGYTAETQLTASSKIGVSYHSSQSDSAVVTTFSFLF